MALAITAQDWTSLGLGDDPTVAPSDDLELTVDRVTALLLIRIVAIHAPKGKYQDLSTTTICRTSLMAGKPWADPISDAVIQELREYVHRIIKRYQENPYHNRQHAYHVTISANKLLDLALNSEIHANEKSKPRMYGLRTDTLMHLLLIFASLVHDVEHRGIPNRQLAMEDDELAILYNDQSIAENRSLTIAFRELLKKDFENLRKAMFVSDEEYRRFRKTGTNIVLQTDIASPERTQIRKSKWKEAFGEEYESMEARVKHELKRRASGDGSKAPHRSSAKEIITELAQLRAEDSLTNTPEASETGEDIAEIDKDLKAETSEATDDNPMNYPIPGVARDSITSMSVKNPVTRLGRSASLPEPKPVPRQMSVPGADALGYSDTYRKFQRRISSAAGHQRRLRLGISRSIDLSGEFIESFTRGSIAVGGVRAFEEDEKVEDEEDESDELKISVILEQLLTASGTDG
jgi:hypothetical protein